MVANSETIHLGSRGRKKWNPLLWCPRQILPLRRSKALEVVGGLLKRMQRDRLRARAVRRPLDALRLLQLLGEISLASPIGGEGEVRNLRDPNLVHAPLHEEIFSPRAKFPVRILALPIERRLARLERKVLNASEDTTSRCPKKPNITFLQFSM